MIRLRDVRLLYVRELRCALRERSIIINSVILQIVLYPAILWLIYTGISFVQGQTEGFTSRIMIRGLAQEHRLLREELEKDDRISLQEAQDPEAELRAGSLDLLVEFLPAGDAGQAGNFRVRLVQDESKDRSTMAGARMSQLLTLYRDHYLAGKAAGLGLSPQQLQPFWVESRNVASSRQMGQFLLGQMLPVFLIIMLNIGCMYPAIDSTAGEREKSTWETTLTYATSRVTIVAAKYLYVSTMAAFAGILNLTAMLLTMRPVLAPILSDSGADFTFRIPAASIPLIVLADVLLALFVAAGMMILASFARNFKEGQSLVGPFYIAVILPVLFLQLPGLELTPYTASIPVINVALVFRDVITGQYNWPMIGWTLVFEVLCVALLLRLAVAILKHEDYVIGSYGGNFGRFLKQRLLRSGRQRESAQ
ncbi:MAG: ABC transporter permease [Acidobacteriota bacterium]